jgi:hypothetical protein
VWVSSLKSFHRRDILGFYIPWASDRSKLNWSFFPVAVSKFIFANNSCIDTTLLDSVRLMYRLTIKRGATSCLHSPPPTPHPILFHATHPCTYFPPIHFTKGVLVVLIWQSQQNSAIVMVFLLFRRESKLNFFECSFIHNRVYAASQPSDFCLCLAGLA